MAALVSTLPKSPSPLSSAILGMRCRVAISIFSRSVYPGSLMTSMRSNSVSGMSSS